MCYPIAKGPTHSDATKVSEWQVYDLIELKAQAFQGEIFAVSIHMSNFHSNHNRSYGWDWEVCNGMVVREIPGVLPDLISVSSDDES